MNAVRPAAPQLAGLQPYDPKYLPAEIMLSANENSLDVPFEIRREVEREVRRTALNRYPDPLANDLRDMIAEANGLDRDQVLMGNGGDELLFDMALAWGGPGRTFMNLPPTFSVYANNARLTNTNIVNVPRRADFSIDEEAVLERLAQGDIDFTIVTSPNNPTGDLAHFSFVKKMLETADTLVMVDEAYFEFSRYTARPLLAEFDNLIILRTFSKAFSMAGVRLGYVLGSDRVLSEFKKVRQPYSVDAVSQAIARVVFANRAQFERGIDTIIEERERLEKALNMLPCVMAYPSESNYILFKVDERIDAAVVWERLFESGILIRDFSRAQYMENCLRVSVGTPDENTRFLETLESILKENMPPVQDEQNLFDNEE